MAGNSGLYFRNETLCLLLGFFVQKVFETNFNSRRVKNQALLLYQLLKIDITNVPLFLLIFYSWGSKIEICLKFGILEKKS